MIRIEPSFSDTPRYSPTPDFLSFSIIKTDTTYSVMIDNGEGIPTTFVENVRHLSTAAQMILEGLRRTTLTHPNLDLRVIDYNGEWANWLTHSFVGSKVNKIKIPIHTIID